MPPLPALFVRTATAVSTGVRASPLPQAYAIELSKQSRPALARIERAHSDCQRRPRSWTTRRATTAVVAPWLTRQLQPTSQAPVVTRSSSAPRAAWAWRSPRRISHAACTSSARFAQAPRTKLHPLREQWPDQLEIETVDITSVDQVAALRSRLQGKTFDLLLVNAGIKNDDRETIADVSPRTLFV